MIAVVGFVTSDDSRILLVRVAQRGWEMPGGQVEEGEDLVAALRREVKEEAGCVVEPERLLGVYPRVAPAPALLALLFRCRHVEGEPHATEIDVPEARWCTREEARRLVTRPAAAQRLADALDDDPGVVYRPYRLHPYTLLGASTI